MKLATMTALATLTLGVPASATDWNVLPEESTLGIIGHQNDVAFEGEFLDFDAAISFDPDDPAAATIEVEIDMASLDTNNPQRDDVARGIDLFYVAEYPTAQFTANGFAAEGDDAYGTIGNLTIRDVTQQVTLPFTLSIDGHRAHAVGELVIDRMDFGVGHGQWAGDSPVSHEITITVDIVAEASN